MSAATLSPTEHSEAVRFGIHDADVIAEMEDRAHDDLPCVIAEGRRRCGATATHVLVCVHCNRQAATTCERHAVIIVGSDQPARHATCGAAGALRDLVRVVPL